ncbi:hypothetical protein ACSBR1_000886 [Camellia fascicularis]
MNRCNLMDLGCSGPQLTSSNERQGLANTLERLDRAVCNSEWRMAFTEGAVRNLPRTYSDHSPLIVFTQGKIKLNTDGCARGDPGEGGFGGLFHDETGIWLCGFFGKLETCYSLEVEMWGIYRGLTIVLEKGLVERRNCSIQYIMQEANQCADKLANMGADQVEHLLVMEEPPLEVRSLIVADLVGTAFRRL